MEVKSVLGMLFFFILCWKSNAQSSEELRTAKKIIQNYELDKAEIFIDRNFEFTEAGKLYLGNIASHLKEWDKAIDYYKSLVELDPNSAEYHFKVGGAMGMKAIEINKFQAAFLIPKVKEHLEKAVSLDPNHIESKRALSELYLQLPSVLGGSFEKGLAQAKSLNKLSKLDYCIAMASVYNYKDEKQKSAKYIKEGIKALKGKPSLVLRNYLYFEFAQEGLRYGIPKSGIDSLMDKYIQGFNYLDLKTPAEAYLKLAQISEKKSDKSTALYYINKSLEIDGNSKTALDLKEDIKDM
ncbi:tetratricopeptide repeat protein [Zunongwangia sp. HRR-M8]|uniref:tetratricopeptide repeat protein n=1 Tax=Zunongwangia sp. HRR-M8 TaxID=3015170 RepID=UPI0022DD1758|nr:tetratricopeptide repeat protein [Zunongwangia sp. HRR-M8]WBL21884.1 hypothetical protein PBT89_14305 [Zunongwangia sp. HRR-M8]